MLIIKYVRRLLLAALIATSVLSLHVASAAAIKLALSESGFRTTWAPMRFTAGSLSISCNLTLEGSFHSRTVAKVERGLIGYVSRASVAACSGGTATVLSETLPWHVQYGGFAGTLPNISRVTLRVIGASVRLAFAEFREFPCLGRTETNTPGVVIATRNEAGVLTSMRFDASSGIPMTGNFICTIAGRGLLVGSSSSATGAGGAGAISLTLIGELPTLSPSPVEFGRVEAGAVTSRAVTIRAGTDALEVTSVAVRSGANVAILDPDRCVGSRLAERGTCVFKTIFAAPRETGRTFEDVITVGTSVRTLEAAVRAST
jgi:hypothetical protein